jgi:hypothetical protein
MFEKAGIPCPRNPDIEAALWTKLTLNCAFNAVSALGDSPYGRMAEKRADTRRDGNGRARGGRRRPRRRASPSTPMRSVAATWKLAASMPRQYSSTAQDMQRGKATEIDALNGYVAERGAALGVDAPVNRTLHALVKLREAARIEPGGKAAKRNENHRDPNDVRPCSAAAAGANRIGLDRPLPAGAHRCRDRRRRRGASVLQVYFRELLAALDRTIAGLGEMIVGLELEPRAVHAHLQKRCRLLGAKNLTGMALGGLDMAVWDAYARAQGKSLARALGAEPRAVNAYNSVGLYDAQSVVAICEETRAAGYAGLKIKAGFSTLREDLAAIRAAP